MSDRCRSCDAPIVWARTANRRAAPMVEHPEGEFVLWTDGGVVSLLRLAVLAEDDPRRNVQKRYRSHFADCPHSSVHRRTR
jgi:hypothetical protein